MNNIKNLDVRDIKQQVDSTKDFISKTKESVEQVKQALNGITTLHDGFAGNTADSIRSFYEEAHKPFLEFMESFLVQYEEALSTVNEQVLSFEPNESGFIRQEFLEGELTSKMQKAQDSLSATTDAINQQLNSVSDLASVSHVKDDVFLDSIADAKKRITKNVDNMYEMDSNATSKLDNSEDDMKQMKTYVSKLRSAIDKNSITVDKFNITQFNSEFFSYHNEFKLMAKGRNALATGEKAEITAEEFEKLFPYKKNEEYVSDGHFEWHGTYYTLKDGRIVREYKHDDGVSFEFVDKIPDPRSAPPSGFDKFAKGTWDFFTEDFFTVFDSNATKGERLLALGMLTPWGKGAKVLKKGGEGISDFAKYIDELGDSKSAVKKGSKEVKEGTDNKIKSASGAKQDDSFIGTLKGEKIHLKDVKVEEITYTKRLPEETAMLRRKFNSSIRKNYLKEFSTDPVRVEYLKKAGLNENDIARMKNGLNPKGWQVHHNLPLDDGGTNDFSNLVLIKNDPYHKVVTNEQNSLTRDLLPSQSKKINWPMFKNEIYPPEQFK
ncbi:T7SS effector LXG polymorphic toxin [Terribacillus sp. JSM ZJ617]|uniref:T7SS effector LXG polymorphic toxin n=1 Tax=Terribacillus sp. JSM ZJ617 TaxID=3342119 RepID=UPI0035A8D8CD